MRVKEYIEQLLKDPSEKRLKEAGKLLKMASRKSGGSIAYELKILSKEIGSLASFANPQAGIMYWSEDKRLNFIKNKVKNLSKAALNTEIPLKSD